MTAHAYQTSLGKLFIPFPHEYSRKAPSTMNNSLNKLSRLYIEQRNYLSGPLVYDII